VLLAELILFEGAEEPLQIMDALPACEVVIPGVRFQLIASPAIIVGGPQLPGHCHYTAVD
jgi:hypothetical protein